MNRVQPTKPVSGFTLIEVMMSLSIISVLTGIAVSSFNALVESDPISVDANNIVLAALTARVEAVKRAQTVRISASDPGGEPDGWDSGLIVYVDNDGNGAYGAGDHEIRRVRFTAARTIAGPDGLAGFDYLSTGAINTAPVTFKLCGESHGGTGRAVTVSGAGQIYSADHVCG